MTSQTRHKSPDKYVRVKFLTKCVLEHGESEWRKRLPGSGEHWNNCHFSFDPDEREYDWLLVYEDLPAAHQTEILACHKDKTILATSEPTSVKHYGRRFLSQFGTVLTSQENWAINHPNTVRSQSGMAWHYAFDERSSYDYLVNNPLLIKTHNASTICSTKRSPLTQHKRRYDFTMRLKTLLPELKIFGRGIRPVQEKADAIADYKYHIAIENHRAPHHFSEKLIDVFLGMALPVYYGAPNIYDYFPEESIVLIELNDPESAAECLKKLIRDNAWEKRLDAIKEARRRVLEEYHLFAMTDKIIASGKPQCRATQQDFLLSRHEIRRRSFPARLETIGEKAHVKARSFWSQVIRPYLAS
ncbi:MAG: glycosyltransferase family 10 [Gammaproteobacteria bacterium]